MQPSQNDAQQRSAVHRVQLLGEPLTTHGSGRVAAAFAKGFRPFFLLAAVLAAIMIPLWVLVVGGQVPAGAHATLDPTLWHAHEMIFGFAAAVIAGFLLTAVGNWTGRETAVGVPLALLCVLWLAGRIGVSLGSTWPRGSPALLDLAFLPALAIALARPLLAAKNYRNLVMLGVLAALWLANGAMHAEALGFGQNMGRRAALVAVDVVTFVIALMAGRTFPMFTRNATGVTSIRNVPSLDRAALGALASMTIADLVAPNHAIAAWLALIAGGLAIARAFHWYTRRAFSIPLVWVLHVGYAWLPIGLFLKGTSALGVVSAGPTLATHALTVGAIGILTLGMMARVSLGHTGRPLAPPRLAVFAFWAVALAALVRVAGPLLFPEQYLESVTIAGTLWGVGFLSFAVAYARILVSPRVDGKAG